MTTGVTNASSFSCMPLLVVLGLLSHYRGGGGCSELRGLKEVETPAVEATAVEATAVEVTAVETPAVEATAVEATAVEVTAAEVTAVACLSGASGWNEPATVMSHRESAPRRSPVVHERIASRRWV
jgi:hypothetical protein